MAEALPHLSVVELRPRIGNRKTSPVERLEACIGRIGACDAAVNAPHARN